MRATFVYIVCVCFPTTMAEMSNVNRAVCPTKPQVFTLWLLQKKFTNSYNIMLFKKIIKLSLAYTTSFRCKT